MSSNKPTNPKKDAVREDLSLNSQSSNLNSQFSGVPTPQSAIQKGARDLKDTIQLLNQEAAPKKPHGDIGQKRRQHEPLDDESSPDFAGEQPVGKRPKEQ